MTLSSLPSALKFLYQAYFNRRWKLRLQLYHTEKIWYDFIVVFCVKIIGKESRLWNILIRQREHALARLH